MICRRQRQRALRRSHCRVSPLGCHATALAGECEVRNEKRETRNARGSRHHHPPSSRNVSRRCFRQPSHAANRTHGILRLQPPRATAKERESERESNSCAAQRATAKRAQEHIALVLFYRSMRSSLLPAVSLARNSCIASRQISVACHTALSLEEPLSRSRAALEGKTSCRCLRGLRSRNCVLLSGILIQIPFLRPTRYREFAFIAK